MLKINKYLLFFLGCFLIFFACQQAFALEVGLQYGSESGLGAQDIRITIAQIIRTSMGILGIMAVILVIISGAYFMLSRGDPEQKEKAKKILMSALIGLIIILSAYAIASYIINKLVEATGSQQPTTNQNTNNTNQPSGNFILGDADGDGSVTVGDLNIMSNYLNSQPTTCHDRQQNIIDCKLVLDLDGDGEVTVWDSNILDNILLYAN